MLCSAVFLIGLVMLGRNGIFTFFGTDVCNRILCAIKAISCLSDVLTVHQNLLFNCEYETVTAQRINFLFFRDI